MLDILAELARWEKQVVNARTTKALAVKRGRRERISLHPSYGYHHESGRVVENPEEQRIIRRIKRLRSKGVSVAEITRRLNKEGVPARGARFHEMTLHRLLKR